MVEGWHKCGGIRDQIHRVWVIGRWNCWNANWDEDREQNELQIPLYGMGGMNPNSEGLRVLESEMRKEEEEGEEKSGRIRTFGKKY